jgi:hypothetical protein
MTCHSLAASSMHKSVSYSQVLLVLVGLYAVSREQQQ